MDLIWEALWIAGYGMAGRSMAGHGIARHRMAGRGVAGKRMAGNKVAGCGMNERRRHTQELKESCCELLAQGLHAAARLSCCPEVSLLQRGGHCEERLRPVGLVAGLQEDVVCPHRSRELLMEGHLQSGHMLPDLCCDLRSIPPFCMFHVKLLIVAAVDRFRTTVHAGHLCNQP